MKPTSLPNLPLSDYHADFISALGRGPLLLEAEPGAGKSTLAPLWALEAAPDGQQVWLVQPRILAARGVARRLASLYGESVGQTVGYQVPFDRQVSEATRLVVMTPGIALQRLLADPELAGVATVMLDEVHERALDQDTAWAWLQEVAVLREDIALVLMSATPDPALQQQVAQRLSAPGRCFPVSVQYLAPRRDTRGAAERLDEHLLRALSEVADWRAQTVLVFLPGWRTIEDCASALARREPSVRLARLHSRVPDQEQQEALDPASGPRVILATNIAETSLTIPDVTLVIDSGQVRRSVFEQGTGVSRLQTRRISQASAEQRRGRAGRVQAGHCIRLWSQEESLAPAEPPEVRSTDYVPLALRLAHWGSPVEELPWLEAPNGLALERARQQLQDWRLLDEAGRVTDAGRQVAALGTHPRLARFLQTALYEKALDESSLQTGAQKTLPEGALLLALALHFDALETSDQWQAAARAQRAGQRTWQRQAQRWFKALSAVESRAELDPACLADAFRDRIGHRQDSGRYRLNSGISVAPDRPLDSEWAVFADVQARGKGHRGVGWPLTLNAEQRRALSQCESRLSHRGKGWVMHTTWRMGGSVTAEDRHPVTGEALAEALVADLRERGLSAYPWPEAATGLYRRAQLANESGVLDLPTLDESVLLSTLDQWFAPFVTDSLHPDRLPWREALAFYLGHDAVQALDQLLPLQVALPSGRSVSVDYPENGTPTVSGKLQEFFGCDRFELADGRVPLRLHLASPNGSPLAITGDLGSFWQGAYGEVRKQMRGRYPKHPWPEDPASHPPTRLTKKRLGAS
ncbi:ATP-dependent helicase HrpB [Marinimicrobium koreense]|uniref:ATP-dependent helicase HrpB n=1 Tax=Marinimicrobium koreense TaxID=306545 RepID=UPI003F719A63